MLPVLAGRQREPQSKNFQEEFKFQFGVKQSQMEPRLPQSLAVQFTGAEGPLKLRDDNDALVDKTKKLASEGLF